MNRMSSWICFHTWLRNRSAAAASRTGRQTRYRMLETIRQYAWERLRMAGETATLRGRQLEYFAALAEQAFPMLLGPEQVRWFRRLEREIDNLRAALDWSLAANEAQAGLRIAASLRIFWYARAYQHEGRARLRSLLAQPGAAGPSIARARALITEGLLALSEGDLAAAGRSLEDALDLGKLVEDARRPVDDNHITAWALFYLGLVKVSANDLTGGRDCFERSLSLARQSGYAPLIQRDMLQLGSCADLEGDTGACALLVGRDRDLMQGFRRRNPAGRSVLQPGLSNAATR